MKSTTTGNPVAPAVDETRQLISDLFHQLSQPLTTLCCALELAQLQTPTADQYCEVVSHALGQAEKVSALATAIREVFDAGQAGGDYELLELRKAVEDTVGDLLPVAEAAGVQLVYAPRSACPVWFDAYRLRQGLFHLLGSILDSGRTVSVVEVELEESGAEAVLRLTCSGSKTSAGAPGSDDIEKDQELRHRVGLGIARAIFEAEGANFTVVDGVEGLSVEVRILRDETGARLSSCARPDR